MKKDLSLRQKTADPFHTPNSANADTRTDANLESATGPNPLSEYDSEEQLTLLLTKIARKDPATFISAMRAALKDLGKGLLKADPAHRRAATGPVRNKALDLNIFAHFSNLNWSEIEIIFISGDGLRIQCRGMEGRYGYEALGFSDRRTVGRPSTLWWLLHSLAEYDGVIPWKNNISANKKLPKRMQLLRDRLQSITGLAADPFYPYRQNKEYRARFKVRVQKNGACRSEPDEPASETSEFFNEEANRYRKHKLNPV